MRKLACLFLLPVLAALGHQSLQSGTAGTTTISTGSLGSGDLHWDVTFDGFSGLSTGSIVQLSSTNGFVISFERNGGSCGAGDYFRLVDNVDGFGPVTIDGETHSFNGYACALIPPGSNFAGVRFQRCAHTDAAHCTWNALGGVQGEILGEAWDFTNQVIGRQSLTWIATLGTISSTAVQIGTSGTGGNVGYVRYCSNLLPLGGAVTMSPPPLPNANQAPGNCTLIEAWELEGNGTAESGNAAHNLAGLGSATYASTPTPAPWAVLPQVSFSTAFAAQLSSASTGCFQDAPNTCTPSWAYAGAGADGVTQTISFVPNNAAANPTLTGLVRGSLNLTLTLTDTASQNQSYTVHDGVVVTDSNHNILSMGISGIDKIYLPAKQWGFNPNPMVDNQGKIMADYFGAFQGNASSGNTFSPAWETPLTGTVTCTQGSNACTTICAGCTPVNNICSNFPAGWGIIIFNVDGSPSVQYHTFYGLASCSTGSITLDRNYIDSTAGANGVSFSAMNVTGGTGALAAGTWIAGTPSNANYYDNIAAFLLFYYVSGIDNYYTYGHNLGLYYWSMPWLNKGKSSNGVYASNLAARVRTEKGFLALFLDGTIPNFFTLIAPTWLTLDEARMTQGTFQLTAPLDDLRERSASLGYVAFAALYASGSTKTTAVTSIQNAMTGFWNVQQPGGLQANGSYVNVSFANGSFSPNGSGGGLVTVHNGSTTVTGSGTSWLTYIGSGTKAPYFIGAGTTSTMACNNAVDVPGIPQQNYTVNSDTSITLAANYTGPDIINGAWEFATSSSLSGVVGCGTQPFMSAYNANDMYYAYLAYLSAGDSTNAARAKAIILNEAAWMENVGFMGATQSPAPLGYNYNAMAYWVSYSYTNPDIWHDENNWINVNLGGQTPTLIQNNIQNERVLSAETMGAFAWAKILGDTSSIPQTLYDATYGGMGGGTSAADNYSIWGLMGGPMTIAPDFTNGGAPVGGKAKDFGFTWGLGAAPMFAAATSLAVNQTPGGIQGGAAVSGGSSVGHQ